MRDVVTLCGSTRFKKEIEAANLKLTLAGRLVFSMGAFGHSGDAVTAEQKEALDKLHRRKIDLSEGIVVVCPRGYIGDSTSVEIEYARRTGKWVEYWTGEANE